MKSLKKVNNILALPFIRAIKLYQLLLSPDKSVFFSFLKWKVCSHEPHCSEYCIRSLRRYGLVPWLFRSTERVLSCFPSMTKKYNPDHYRVVFCSSAHIGIPFLEEIQGDKRYELVWVVTMPDAPSWRGMKVSQNVIKTKALEYLSPENIKTPSSLRLDSAKYWDEARQFQERLTNINCDLLVVIAYWKIIPKNILNIPNIAPINVHGSLLPKYRWASPIQTTLLNWDHETWITIMAMNEWVDTWDILSQKKIILWIGRATIDLINHMMEVWPKFLNDSMREFCHWRILRKPQDESKAILCSKIKKEDGLINPRTDSFEEIHRKYKAFYLRPRISFVKNDKKFIIDWLMIDIRKYAANKDKPLFTDKNTLNEIVSSIWIKPEGKKTLKFEEFKNGYLK